MEPKIVEIKEKKLIGMRTSLSLSNDTTRELWQQFMPRRKEIINPLDNGFFSMKIYDDNLEIKNFTPQTVFEKWAAIEVSDISQIPEGMESHVLSGGKYALFIHKGPASTFSQTLQFIFETWLPNSQYELDNREHFEIMQENYHPNDPDAEEEVWIPITHF